MEIWNEPVHTASELPSGKIAEGCDQRVSEASPALKDDPVLPSVEPGSVTQEGGLCLYISHGLWSELRKLFHQEIFWAVAPAMQQRVPVKKTPLHHNSQQSREQTEELLETQQFSAFALPH